MSQLSVEGAKAQARALRAALQAQGRPISHAQALELVARQHGARDWNTLHARLGQRNAPPELSLGDRVRGCYLGQDYSGRIIALSGPTGHRQVEIRLDRPVDTVRFESFSNLRHQIRGTIDETGRSQRKTSDGKPHLTVEKAPS
ncbi:glyoxalase superfamily protein [Paracoccus sp. MBLB3053]|uniref:Glyoxalase superfamily protein n=1 Tax=Paracoccus aurantius TaxID=3073814 RepID=A0ABU2HZK8_9RHOB|nr:glyoxalase superfamily protein [Paracoccus sp. MBLB3053]MDS9469985.1 glyoxalase superfamily protein [Paracoccus sp. MBLB3053]